MPNFHLLIFLSFHHFISSSYISYLNDSVLQHNLPIRQLRQLFVVRDDDERLFEGISKDKEKVVKFTGVLGVKIAGGLVGEDELGVVHQSTSHRNSLLLTS